VVAGDPGALRQIVPGAEQLDVFRFERCAALREGQYVIEVELVGRTTNHASPAVPVPYLDLDGSRNQPPALGRGTFRTGRIVLILHGNELELEYGSPPIALLPRIHEMKNPVV